MSTPLEILKQYWNFNSFRDKQDEIIDAVLTNKDTLALLPTGGGKSLCYQVPAMVTEGICLVISPLIALMEDQVNNLKSRNIKAIAINSSMSKRQIDIALDNAIYGDIKFLYVSPERLKTRLFQVRFAKMNVNLIAVDEAHCISEWGYDFRPSYMEIAALRSIQPKVPFLALTATATSNVVVNIQEQLLFKTQHVIQKSFERPNITYNTQLTNNKLNRIETLLKQQDGSGIIYCGTRRNVKEHYIYLSSKGYSVDYYHAGLPYEERKTKQANWTQNKTRVIIATNAFGMGIDKPDVRFVMHIDLPASLEAYFQEAGRAGRDGNPAETHLFYNTNDIQLLNKNIALKYPPIATIKKIYNALGNHLQLAIGSGLGETYPINLAEFAEKYDQPLLLCYNAIKFLELCHFITLSENYKLPSKLRVLASNNELYNHQVKDDKLNKVIQFILRTEIGIHNEHLIINEFKIANKTGLTVNEVKDKLAYLSKLELVDYVPKSNLPQITFITERLTDNNLSISPVFYHNRKKVAEQKRDAVVNYLTEGQCNSAALLNYFGEQEVANCGKCNNCLTDKVSASKTPLKKLIIEKAQEQLVNHEQVEIMQLVSKLSDYSEKEILDALRIMAENKTITLNKIGKAFTLNR